MAKRGAATRSDGSARLAPGPLSTLRSTFDGEIIQPDDPEYDVARQVWNSMIDRRPALIVRPIGTADVVTAVRFAREESLEVAVRGGGHSPAGHATLDDGMVIDLSRLRTVRIEADRDAAWVSGGCLLADVDRETAPHGLAVPAGVVWDTGVGGLTLGGGFGWLSRRYGLTVDALEAVELVTAAGDVVVVDADSDPELFWGLRGGGGNFGIATWLHLRLRPVPAEVHYLDLTFSVRDAPAVLDAYRTMSSTVGREATTYLSLQTATAQSGLSDAMVGRPMVMAGVVVIDDHADMEAIARPLREAARPLTEVPGAMPFRALQRASSEAPGSRRRRYWKAHYVRELTDAFIADFIGDDLDPERPLFGELELFQLGGAIGDVPADATAYAQRDAAFDVLAIGYWDDPAEDELRVGALRAAADRLSAHTSGVYLNDLLDEGEDRVRAAFRDDRFERLRRLKTRMDPDNVFHRNANIPPII
jgi:FAD/FMN-containing dehydrogenase